MFRRSAALPQLTGLGDRLREAREIAGLSARMLGELAGTSHATVAYIERGRSQTPRADVLLGLALVLGVRIEWLAMGVGDPPLPRTIRKAVQAAIRSLCDSDLETIGRLQDTKVC